MDYGFAVVILPQNARDRTKSFATPTQPTRRRSSQQPLTWPPPLLFGYGRVPAQAFQVGSSYVIGLIEDTKDVAAASGISVIKDPSSQRRLATLTTDQYILMAELSSTPPAIDCIAERLISSSLLLFVDTLTALAGSVSRALNLPYSTVLKPSAAYIHSRLRRVLNRDESAVPLTVPRLIPYRTAPFNFTNLCSTYLLDTYPNGPEEGATMIGALVMFRGRVFWKLGPSHVVRDIYNVSQVICESSQTSRVPLEPVGIQTPIWFCLSGSGRDYSIANAIASGASVPHSQSPNFVPYSAPNMRNIISAHPGSEQLLGIDSYDDEEALMLLGVTRCTLTVVHDARCGGLTVAVAHIGPGVSESMHVRAVSCLSALSHIVPQMFMPKNVYLIADQKAGYVMWSAGLPHEELEFTRLKPSRNIPSIDIALAKHAAKVLSQEGQLMWSELSRLPDVTVRANDRSLTLETICVEKRTVIAETQKSWSVGNAMFAGQSSREVRFKVPGGLPSQTSSLITLMQYAHFYSGKSWHMNPLCNLYLHKHIISFLVTADSQLNEMRLRIAYGSPLDWQWPPSPPSSEFDLLLSELDQCMVKIQLNRNVRSKDPNYRPPPGVTKGGLVVGINSVARYLSNSGSLLAILVARDAAPLQYISHLIPLCSKAGVPVVIGTCAERLAQALQIPRVTLIAVQKNYNPVYEQFAKCLLDLAVIPSLSPAVFPVAEGESTDIHEICPEARVEMIETRQSKRKTLRASGIIPGRPVHHRKRRAREANFI